MRRSPLRSLYNAASYKEIGALVQPIISVNNLVKTYASGFQALRPWLGEG